MIRGQRKTSRLADGHSSQLPSGRHGLPREYVLASQRSRLLAASIAVAGEHGYAGMTVSAVIAGARVSRKTFYEFFADREACFLEAFDILLEDSLAGFRAAYEEGGAQWPQRLRSGLATALEALAAHPAEARVGFVEVFAAGPRALSRRDEAMRAFMEFVQPGFAAAPDALDVPPLAAEAVVGAIYEVIYTRVLHGRVGELPDLLPQLLFVALTPFLGAEAAGAHAAAPGRRSPAPLPAA